MTSSPRAVPLDASAIVRDLPDGHRRVLLIGPTGAGKTTLAAGLAHAWGGPALAIGADPGTPAFGLPGAVNLGEWHGDAGWRCLDSVPLCTLDAVRFRLPLVCGVVQLMGRGRALTEESLIMVDAPGVIRGAAAAELLHALADAAAIDTVLVVDPEEAASLAGDVGALGCAVLHVPADPAARRPGKFHREQARTALWDAHLAEAATLELPLASLNLTGTPPPLSVPEAWKGRQIALSRGNEPLAMGEIVRLGPETVTVTLPGSADGADSLLIRDAGRNPAGYLVTSPAQGIRAAGGAGAASGIAGGRRALTVAVAGVEVELVNGVLGDPLVALRLANVHGRVLFDLGDAAAMSVKALHGVSHVFVSHGHLDHIGGFVALLRARLSGSPPPCRIYGPPGMHGHVAGFVNGIHWDRIGDAGPGFLVAEVGRDTLDWVRVQPGREPEALGSEALEEGVLLRSQGYEVRCVTLDHGIPVLAFRLQLPDTLHVREAALAALGVAPGPWLGELKYRLSRGETDALVALPGTGGETAGKLGAALVDMEPGTRIAYATDLADSRDNRSALSQLARDADLLICEATFLAEDADQALATRHLTARACVEIAAEAGVRRLLPFHFSRRYSKRLPAVYGQIRDAARGTRVQGKVVGSP